MLLTPMAWQPPVRRGAAQLGRRHISTTPQAVASLLRDTVRERDYAAYLTHVTYPRALQPHFFALRAFHVELASLKDVVSNELVGRVRMQWWRDAVESVYRDQVPQHPIAQGLHAAIRDPVVAATGSLVKDHFLRIIDAREADLAEPLAPPTLAELEQYAESTSSRMLYLLTNLVGVSEPFVDEVMSHLGKAMGLTVLVAALPHHTHPAPRRRAAGGGGAAGLPGSKYAPQADGVPRTPTLPLPLEYVVDAGVVQEDVFRHGIHAKGLRDAIFQTATRANDYLITARTALEKECGGRVPTAVLGPALLSVRGATLTQGVDAAVLAAPRKGRLQPLRCRTPAPRLAAAVAHLGRGAPPALLGHSHRSVAR